MKASVRQAAVSSLRVALWLALSLVVMTPPVLAQDSGIETWVEYQKQLKDAEHISALEEGLAG